MRWGRISFALLAFGVMSAQEPEINIHEGPHWYDRLRGPYLSRTVTPVHYENSPRIDSLLRAGNLYLSLQDAIALALENNLDIELQRFTPEIARTDVQRTQGGGLPRGVSINIAEAPAGIGGPGTPLLNSAATGVTATTIVPNFTSDVPLLSETPGGIAVLGPFALSTGPAIPVFDPAIAGQIQLEHLTTPQANSLVAGTNALTSKSFTGNIGLVQGFSPGTSINLGLNSSYQNSNSTRTSLNPYTSANLGLTVTQPLLRGFGISLNRRYIRIAKNNQQISDLVFRQQLIATVSGVIRLYDDLVSLTEDVKVKQQTLELAQRLYEDNKNKVELGTLAAIELVRADAQVAAGRQDLANSQGFLLQQELVLKTYLTRRGTADPRVREARIVATDTLVVPDHEEPRPIQDLVAEAIENRPELGEAQLQIKNSRINLQGSRNELLPQLDIIGIAQNSGLGGQLNPLATSNNLGSGLSATPNVEGPYVGNAGTAIGQIARRNYPTYGVGLQLNLPLRNRIAIADQVRDELQVRQTEIRRQQLENQVRLEVEDAVVAQQRSRAAYEAARRTRELQEQSLAIERDRYEVGLDTNYLVLQYQSYLAQARSTEVAAKSIYVKARTALERALGSTLEAHNISVDEALHGKISTPPSALPVLPNGSR